MKAYKNITSDFKASKISTALEWNDIVLDKSTTSQLSNLGAWLKHNTSLRKDKILGNRMDTGYRALFYGTAGTGKTLAATLIGKQFKNDVFRIDLSSVVNKYIGETEKNLDKIFDKVQGKNWILFFDEADALFGNRTDVKDFHDRYATQEASYLLQKAEQHTGLTVLSSNMKSNIDSAFTRRFNTIIHFVAPNREQRLSLWGKILPASVPLATNVDIVKLAEEYELTGETIRNAVHTAALKALSLKNNAIQNEYILEGINQELRKETTIIQ